MMPLQPIKIKVRFRDCDMIGHVNNAVYLSYFEQARIHYFEQMLNKTWNYHEFGIILVRNEVVYLHPLLLNDSPEIYMYLAEVGNKSFTFSYEVKVKDKVYTTGTSKLVCFNFKTKKSVPVYPEFIEAFKKLEQKND